MSEMSYRVEIDWARCEAHGVCEVQAPKVYRLNDDDELEILQDPLNPQDVAAARTGAAACPMAAARIVPATP